MRQTLLYVLCLLYLHVQAHLNGAYTIYGSNPDFPDLAMLVPK